MNFSLRKVLSILGIVCVISLGAVLLFRVASPKGGLRMAGWRAMSVQQTMQIGAAVQSYRQNHGGQAPVRLSDLAAYVPSINVFYFNCRYVNTHIVTNASLQGTFIDVFSPYRLFGMHDHRMVVCEEPGMWEDGTIGYSLISADPNKVIPDEFGRFPASDFEARLRDDFKEGVKSGGEVWQIQYRVEGRDRRINLSVKTPQGIEQKVITTPFVSLVYDFCKFQYAGVSADDLGGRGEVIAKLLVNGRIRVQKWASGTNATISWVVGSGGAERGEL